MKLIWQHSIKLYIKLGLFFYFRRIKVIDAGNIPKNKPVLFLSNHQNALLDALIIATTNRRISYFLTRASVFKKSFVSKLLKSLDLIPVYRIRDGWGSITNNNSIFDSCTKLLHANQAIVIFPEGNHNLNRKVRPLSKGFTRIVFNTLEKYPETDLQLIPIGLNFADAEKFGDSVSVYFGKSIAAKSFVSDNRNAAVLQLKKAVHTEISKLTTHIPTENYEETLQKLDALHVDYLNPKDVNTCIATNFKGCKQESKSKLNGLRLFLKGALILNLLLPYLIWKFVVQPKIEQSEFVSTFRFALAITLVPLYLLIICCLLALIFDIGIGLSYLFFVLLLALFVVKL